MSRRKEPEGMEGATRLLNAPMFWLRGKESKLQFWRDFNARILKSCCEEDEQKRFQFKQEVGQTIRAVMKLVPVKLSGNFRDMVRDLRITSIYDYDYETPDRTKGRVREWVWIAFAVFWLALQARQQGLPYTHEWRNYEPLRLLWDPMLDDGSSEDLPMREAIEQVVTDDASLSLVAN